MKALKLASLAAALAIGAASFWPTQFSVADEAMKMAQNATRDHLHHGLPSPLPITPDDLTRRERFPYVPQSVTYPTLLGRTPPETYPDDFYNCCQAEGSVLPQIGDGSNDQGGIPPAVAQGKEPPVIPSNFSRTGWTFSGGNIDEPPAEAKFRTHCNFSHNAYEDPILYPNRKNISHLHTFFGNTKMGADSTYQSLRTTGGSTCASGPINRSGYWYPAVLKDDALGDGKTMILKPNYAVVYYVDSLNVDHQLTRFPRGFQYIAGTKLSDRTNSGRVAEVAAANALSVTNGGSANYQVIGTGYYGWKCESTNGSTQPGASPVNPGSNNQPYLRNADGTPTLVCPTNEQIGFVTVAPQCWDGVNLWSPNGHDHVRQAIRESGSGRVDICPTGWYKLPKFELIVWFTHDGSDDYKEWYFSSDRIGEEEDWFLNGQSGHMDWYGAWDYEFMTAWMVNCTGITTETEAGNAQECNDTTFGNGRQGLVSGAAPDGSRNPQVSFTEYSVSNRWDEILAPNENPAGVVP